MRRKILLTVAIVLILAGLATVGYPVYLRIQGKSQQQRLAREFQQHKQPSSPVLQEDPQLPDPSPELLQWTELPPTRLEIPTIDLTVQVDAVDDMGIFAKSPSQPPSYYPTSAMPGAVGNVSIAGHRGGSGGYFLNLDKLEPGDEIILNAPGVTYIYEVEKVWIVLPTAVEVIAPLDYPALTLTTCQREGRDYSALRLIVRAKLSDAYLSNQDE